MLRRRPEINRGNARRWCGSRGEEAAGSLFHWWVFRRRSSAGSRGGRAVRRIDSQSSADLPAALDQVVPAAITAEDENTAVARRERSLLEERRAAIDDVGFTGGTMVGALPLMLALMSD